MRHLLSAALFDRDVRAAFQRPVDGAARQGDIERHAVIPRGERLEVGANLVGDIAVRGRAVGAGDAQVDLSGLHQVPAGVVRDDGVRHAVRAQFEGGERRALVARAGLVHPDMDGKPGVMRHIDRRERGAPVHAGEPAGIAVGEDVDGFARLALGGLADQRQAVFADLAAGLDVLIAKGAGARIGASEPALARLVAHRGQHLVERPAQVHRRRARGHQRLAGRLQRFVRGILAQGETYAISRRRADQRRAAHLHRPDRVGGILQRGQPRGLEAERQLRLVDDLHRPAVPAHPDRAVMPPIDLHVSRPRIRSAYGTSRRVRPAAGSRQGPAGR